MRKTVKKQLSMWCRLHKLQCANVLFYMKIACDIHGKGRCFLHTGGFFQQTKQTFFADGSVTFWWFQVFFVAFSTEISWNFQRKSNARCIKSVFCEQKTHVNDEMLQEKEEKWTYRKIVNKIDKNMYQISTWKPGNICWKITKLSVYL